MTGVVNPDRTVSIYAFGLLLWDSFIPYNMTVVPKPLPANSGIRVETWRDLDCEAEPAKTAQVMVGAVFPSSLAGSFFRIVIRNASGQHAVQDDQHRMSDRHDRSLLATTRRQLQERGAEYGFLFTSGCPRALNEGHTQVRIAVRGISSFLNSGAFLIAGVQASPACHLFCDREC